MDIPRILKKSGLEEREAKLYLAALELGGGTVQKISKQAGLGRVGSYYTLEKLVSQGLFSVAYERKRQRFIPESPKRLVELAKERTQELVQSLPEILSLTNTISNKPVIRYFEGHEGIAQVLFDPLETLLKFSKKDRIIYAYVSAESAFYALPEEQERFIQKRISLKIPIKWIAPNTELARELKEKDEQSYREMRLVPPNHFSLPTEMNIYGNKVSLIGEKGTQIAVTIEHPEIAKTQREIFDLAWLGAETFSH